MQQNFPNMPPAAFAEWLRQLPKETLAEINRQEQERTEKDWQEFNVAFKAGVCGICGKSLLTFSTASPCLHWLLRPKGFKKKHFPLLYEKFTFLRTEAYVRWVAGSDHLMKNINDIRDEHPGDKLIDFTGKHRHITWSFSCGQSDLVGHGSSNAGNFPHYHFQMQLDGKPFINYSDFHVPFHAEDIYYLELFLKHGDIARQSHWRGTGMNALLETDKGLEAVINTSIPTDDYDSAAFELNTILLAPEGETLSGESIYQAIQEAKKSGRTIASVVRDKFANANVRTIVSPGKGVPEAKPRTPRNR
jgi:hypothetical protein